MSDPIRDSKEAPKTVTEPLLAALEQIESRGSLLGFVPERARRLGLMKAMADHKLVAWNSGASRYELTSFGRQCLADYRETRPRVA
jgi:hypothetical protein